MKYYGDGKDAAYELFEKNAVIWRVVQTADTVRSVLNEQDVKAWEVKKGKKVSALKYWTEERLEDAATQVAAETQAMIKLRRTYGNNPLLILPTQRFDNDAGGMFSISPYAGVVVSDLITKYWATISHKRLVRESQNMAVCLLKTQKLLGIEVKDPKTGKVISTTQYLHKDIKPSNMCRSNKYGIYRLIDWGGFSALDKSVWVDVRSLRYLTREMTFYYPETGKYAAEINSAMAAATNNTTDLYLTGLSIMEFFLGGLPQIIDINYYHDLTDYFEAVWHFSWADYLQDVEMPEAMKDWLLWVLEPEPSHRPQSVECAMGHKWIQQGLPRVEAALKAAEGDWNGMVEGIRMDLDAVIRGSDSSSSCSCGGKSSGQDAGKMMAGVMQQQVSKDSSDIAVAAAVAAAQSVASQAAKLSASDSLSCSTPSIRLSKVSDFSSYMEDSASATATTNNSSCSSGSSDANVTGSHTAAAASFSLGTNSFVSSSVQGKQLPSCCSLEAGSRFHSSICSSISHTAAAATASRSCCCGSDVTQPTAMTVSTQTAVDNESEHDCEVHLMLLVIRDADKTSPPPPPPPAAGPAPQLVQMSDADTSQTTDVSLEAAAHCKTVSDSDGTGTRAEPGQQQQQQQQQVMQGGQCCSSGGALVCASNNSDTISSTCGSGGSGQGKQDSLVDHKVVGESVVRRAVRYHIQQACDFVACMLTGLVD